MIRQLGLCHRANKDAKSHVSIHVCGAVGFFFQFPDPKTPESNEAIKAFGAEKWPMTFHEEKMYADAFT